MISKTFRALFLLAVFSSSAFCQIDSADSDLRKPRTWAISGEIGMNSLASLYGLTATWYAKPSLAVDAGVGESSVGLRPGLRARYLFGPEKIAYFVGAGIKYGLGSGDQGIKFSDPETKKDILLKTEASGFGDLMVGVEFLANNGFLVIANAGYSVLLGGKNYSFAIGSDVSDKTDKACNTIFGSGIMLSVSLGKAF